jgi:hypothetical protein
VAGRFPLYTDADLYGPLVEGLRRAGWNLLRAIEAYPERTFDIVHFERAVREARVMVSNDRDVLEIAERWFEEGRPFPGLIFWAQKKHHRLISIAGFLEAFEELARKDAPFSPYPIVRLKPKS